MPTLPDFALMAVALFLPGLGIELTLQKASRGLFVRVVRSFLLSLAFWPLAIFATRSSFVSLTMLAWGGLALGALLTGRALVRSRSTLRIPSHEAWPVAAFIALTALHLYPATEWLVAPGADMSMHSLMTRLIVEAGRLPTSYEPIFPIHDFGSYAAGLPSIAAVLTTLTGSPVQTTSLIVGLLAYPAITGVLALVTKRFTSASAALVAAWLIVTTTETHAFLLWGGNPTVLSFALAFASMAPLVNFKKDEDARTSGAAFFPLLAVGSGLVHIIPLIGLAYALPLPALLWLRQVPAPRRWTLVRSWLVLVVVAVVLLALPYLLGAHANISSHELRWVMNWQRQPGHGYRGTWEDFPWSIWPYVYQHMEYGLGVGVLAAFAQLWFRDKRQLPWLVFALGALLLTLNSRYWVLPASPALYPERMLRLLLAPMCVTTAVVFGAFERRAQSWTLGRHGWGFVLVGSALLAWSMSRPYMAMVRAGERVTVSPHDLALMEWMSAHLPPDAVIANNYGDAGIWIPALAFRGITHPHSNPFYFDEIDAWRLRTAPHYLFLGERRFYDVQYNRDDVLHSPEAYRWLRSEGEARLFLILDPHPASPSDSWMGR
ncbi:MAG: hypothetical protein ABIP39_08510 [Polyangiaceae bacterium]